jgi:hypothetical protein
LPHFVSLSISANRVRKITFPILTLRLLGTHHVGRHYVQLGISLRLRKSAISRRVARDKSLTVGSRRMDALIAQVLNTVSWSAPLHAPTGVVRRRRPNHSDLHVGILRPGRLAKFLSLAKHALRLGQARTRLLLGGRLLAWLINDKVGAALCAQVVLANGNGGVLG